MREVVRVPGSSAPNVPTPGSPLALAEFPTTADPVGSDPVLAVSSSGSSEPSDMLPGTARPNTCLQQGIRKPKIYTNHTVRYGLFSSSGEPCNHQEALSDPRWKSAMYLESDLALGSPQNRCQYHRLQVGVQSKEKVRW
jgi:hypothetical protein